MRSPVARALGLGSAKEGVAHWWWQRVTALALVPLSLWFVIGVLRHLGGGVDAVHRWVGRPLPAILLIVTLIATFAHLALGLEVVIEDYVETAYAKLGLVVLARLGAIALSIAAVFAVLRIAL
jgi:succinate dehydrogenase / fumarate reductase membrane anchor subunit